MKLLVISPDYASHYLPLSAVAGEARRRGVSTIVATGRGLADRVTSDGFDWCPLVTSQGSNPGLLSSRGPQAAESDDLGPFFAATRVGMVATLRQQALSRARDLLWDPFLVASQVVELVERERPDVVLVDHLSFASTLALRAIGRPFATFVPGHPTQVPRGDELYGYPTAWPRAIVVAPEALADLREVCRAVTASFTERYNDVLHQLSPESDPVADAFAAHGDVVLYNSSAQTRDPHRDVRLPSQHAFLGSCVRAEQPDEHTAAWLANASARSFVYVSFGTFLSARVDVMRQVVEAVRRAGWRTAISTGTADVEALGDIPASWLVRSSLPQVSLLGRASAVITHGGNNTVTESLAGGCPMVVLPFSTDQFAIAADLERTGLGVALDPNRATVDDIVEATEQAMSVESRLRADAGAAVMRQTPGPARAVDRLVAMVR